MSCQPQTTFDQPQVLQKQVIVLGQTQKSGAYDELDQTGDTGAMHQSSQLLLFNSDP